MKNLKWFLLGFLFGALLAASMARAAELPLTATEVELLDEGTRFDDQQVYVEGHITYAALFTGRLNGDYEIIMLTDDNDRSIRIFLDEKMHFNIGDRVAVQGKFHKEGYFAGYPFENFIILQAVYRDRR